MLKGHKVITARFTDQARSVLEVTLKEDDTDKIISYNVTAHENDKNYAELLKTVSLDEIHENTFKYIRSTQRDLKRIAITVAKRNGWITQNVDIDDDVGEKYAHIDPEKATEVETEAVQAEIQYVQTPFDEVLTSTLFNDDKQTDFLFGLKLKLFEMDWVKENPDRILKRELRKANTSADVVAKAIEIWNSRPEKSD
jgi:hypothetical protein